LVNAAFSAGQSPSMAAVFQPSPVVFHGAKRAVGKTGPHPALLVTRVRFKKRLGVNPRVEGLQSAKSPRHRLARRERKRFPAGDHRTDRLTEAVQIDWTSFHQGVLEGRLRVVNDKPEGGSLPRPRGGGGREGRGQNEGGAIHSGEDKGGGRLCKDRRGNCLARPAETINDWLGGSCRVRCFSQRHP
jgi:hypothetical protein